MPIATVRDASAKATRDAPIACRARRRCRGAARRRDGDRVERRWTVRIAGCAGVGSQLATGAAGGVAVVQLGSHVTFEPVDRVLTTYIAELRVR